MKKKLAILAVACTIAILISGFQSTMLFGTQYMTTKPGYSFTIAAPATWWDCNWSYCKPIIIDHTKVQSDQTYYPVLIYRESDDELSAYAQSDGGDIVFVDAYNSTKFKHEIEKYNSGTGELVAWVNVTSVSSTTDTVIYMYYGNPTCEDQWEVVDTWDPNFIMVQHLNEAAGTLYDSTSNNNDGTNTGGVYNSGSKIDGGYDFDGDVGDKIDCGNDSSLDITSAITLEAWVKDPPWMKSLFAYEVKIVDKKEENIDLFENTFNVERIVSVDKRSELIFVALYSDGIILNDMKINEKSIFDNIYLAEQTNNDVEKRIEDIRLKLPDKIKELNFVGYSKPFTIDSFETVKMSFEKEINNQNSNGRISYLVLNSNGLYDYEATTYWSKGNFYTNWDNPYSIYDFILRYLKK
jgi:hypothetical protein